MSRTLDGRFHAEEFGPLDGAIRPFLERVGASASPIYVDISKEPRVAYERYVAEAAVDGHLGAFARNKDKIKLFFIEKLTESFLATLPETATDHARSRATPGIRSSITTESIGCFLIARKSESEYYVILPFAGGRHDSEATLDTAAPIKATKRPALVGDKPFPGGGYVFLVRATLVDKVLEALTTSVLLQEKAVEAAAFAATVRSAKGRIGSELAVHDYRDIYSGAGGISWGGSFGSMFTSFFEERPKHNLDKVLRLLRNYLNPFRQLKHTHWRDVEFLISNLESIRSVYEEGCKKGSSNALMDAVIFDKLKDIFVRCDTKSEEGSLMRRLIFAMDAILPGIASAAGISGITTAAGARTPAAGGAGGVSGSALPSSPFS